MLIKNKDLSLIKKILKSYPYTFYLFGSRTKEKCKEFSDLDLCLVDSLPSSLLSSLEEDFENSDLPYKIDLLEWRKCHKTFRDLIRKDFICLQASQSLLQAEKEILSFLRENHNSKTNRILHGAEFLGDHEAFGAHLQRNKWEEKINEIQKNLGSEGYWWIGPSSYPNHLKNILISRGFKRTKSYNLMHFKELSLNSFDKEKIIGLHSQKRSSPLVFLGIEENLESLFEQEYGGQTLGFLDCFQSP